MYFSRSPPTTTLRRELPASDPHVIGAFAYLLFNSTRNRLISQVRRLRTPRYAIGFVLGLLYFLGLLGHNLFRAPGRAFPSPISALAGTSPFETIVPIFIAIVIAGIWIFGGDMSALAFSEAEVAMLLPAPVARRTLVKYKLAQSQVIILINVIIWTFILRRGSGTLPGVFSAVSVWVMFTTLSLHRMGEALHRASLGEYRAAGQKPKWMAKVFAALIAFMIFVAFIAMPLSAIGSPDGKNPLEFLKSVWQFIESPGVRTVLYPFHLVIAPAFAKTIAAWATAMLPALGIVALHLFWVLNSDAAFEEAAALASTERAKKIDAMRSRRTVQFDRDGSEVKKTISLAPTGIPAVAIVWKNAIALKRTIKLGALIRLPILAFAAAAYFGWKTGDPARAIAIVSFFMAIMLPLISLQVLRSDLRSDMLHLPFLKSLPLAGADLVLAEVGSSAVIMAAMQFVLFVTAAVALMLSPNVSAVRLNIVIGILLTLPLTLLALDGALCTIVNGSAVLFPAWIRLGPSGPGGVEMMGQMMLSMAMSFLVFALMLLMPAALGAGAWFLLSAHTMVAVVVAGVLGSITLAAESYGMIIALGTSFERAEPQQIT
jgi:ABC-2 type transport system permease protein